MKRSFCLRLGLLVLLAACQSPPPTATITPRPVATPWVTPTPVFVGPVISPDGKIRAQVICYRVDRRTLCGTHFPNGRGLLGVPADGRNEALSPVKYWSPDNNSTIVCMDEPAGDCGTYEVWDMDNGLVRQVLPGTYNGVWQWDPDQPHTVLYLESSEYDGFADFLIQYDAAQETESTLSACPDWFQPYPQYTCVNFPGADIGGELSILSGTVDVQMIVGVGAVATSVDMGTRQDSSKWDVAFGKNMSDFSITPKVFGYLATPISYTVHVSGTQAFITDHGIVTSVKADHLDFHFEALK